MTEPAYDAHPDTVATYRDGGCTYEIDHLGISCPAQWGTFMVYLDGRPEAEFCLPPSLNPHPDVPPEAELVEMAKDAVAGDFISQEDANSHMEALGLLGRMVANPN